MAEYSRLAKGSFTATGTSAVINLPFQPDYVELWNYSNIKTAATHSVTRAWWDAKLLDGSNNPTMLELYAGSSTATVFDTVATNGISTFSGGQLLQFGAAQQVIGITKANPASVNVTAHGYNSGDVVVFQGLFQSATTGMPQMNGIPFTVTKVDANNFTVPWNSNQSNYDALSGSPASAQVSKVLYPYLYFPGQSFISAITTGATTTVVTTDAHNFVVGQEVAFRIPTAWGTTQLNSLPNSTTPGSPTYGYVVSVTDYKTVVVNINSVGFTAFTSNIAKTSVVGLSYAQIVAVGDVNTGGVIISSGSVLYPPPNYTPFGTTNVNTINGPAIRGSFVNNTSQGFVIGGGAAAVDTASTIMANTNVIYWHAYIHDSGSP